jgi:hypothetical protein
MIKLINGGCCLDGGCCDGCGGCGGGCCGSDEEE